MTETPSHAEREVERARADLSQTLDALKERLTFGRIVDEARTQFFGDGGSEFVTNLGRQIRENPLPVALVGLGALWLMLGERRGPSSRTVRVYPSEAERMGGYRESFGERAQQAAAQMGTGLRSTAETMRETREGMTERAREVAAEAGESMRSAAGAVSETVRHAGETAADWMHQAGSAARTAGGSMGELGQRTSESIRTMAEEQPLVLGAIGMALGALVGAMLPSTRMENQYLGEARDQLREAIVEQGGELYERGKVTATEAYRAAAEEARKQGLLPEEGEGKTFAEKAEQVLTKAGEAAKEAGQREAGAALTEGGPKAQTAAGEGVQPQESIRPGSPVIPDQPSAPVRRS